MDYLDFLPQTSHHQKLCSEHTLKQQWIGQNKKGFLRYRVPCETLSTFTANHIDLSTDSITIGSEQEVGAQERTLIRENLKAFMPWRKGPFSIFGNQVDAEWRSEKKWHRLLPRLPELKDKAVADIGCNNGYYMFRMAHFNPRIVVGFEPSVQHYYCFSALKSMTGLTNLHIDLLGVEHIGLFPECFDVIFLMGVIYHRSSPIDVLKDIYSALRPGGTLLLESQAIPGDSPYALFPEKTYAKAPGTYFVPTGPCLRNWMYRAGFKNAELFSTHPMSNDEQRKTEWMGFESYDDFIDNSDPSKTVEGYPAPCRVLLSATKS